MTPLENLIIRETQAKDRESLNDYQLGKLIETVEYAKEKSSFYRERLKEVGTDKIRSLKDIEMIPFTYPKDIAERSCEFLCLSQKYVSRIVTLKTSGTTMVEGKRIFFTDHDLNLTVNFFEEGFKAMVSPGDRLMIMMPGGSYGSLGDIIKKSLDRIGIESFIYGILRDSRDAGSFIEDKGINSMVALPLQALYLSKTNKAIFKKHIKKLMLSADYVPEILIKRFTENFNIKVFTHYGITETGYGCAVECEELKGCHIRENDIYLEIVDPLTGQVLEDGNMGEIVLTTFNRQAMPLIRYRTGDYGLYKAEKCPCGTFLKTIERSKGRISNEIFINNRSIHMSEFDEIIFQYDLVLDYTITISNDNIIVKVFLTEESPEIKEIIKKTLYDKFNLNITVKFSQEETCLSANTMIKRAIINKNN